MPSKTLSFLSAAQVTFQPVDNNFDSIKIMVGNQNLGIIGSTPVTIFVTNNSGSTSITWKTIDPTDYMANNSSNRQTDTFASTIEFSGQKMSLGDCNNGERFKIIGWDDDTIGQILCDLPSSEFTPYFGVNTEMELKCKAEFVDDGRGTGNKVWKMIARYSSNVFRRETAANALCSTSTYCCVCN